MILDKYGFPDMVRNGHSGYGDIGYGNVHKRAVELLSSLSDKKFLNFWYDDGAVCLYTADEIGQWDKVWRHEWNRRFLLRPALPFAGSDKNLLTAV